MEPAALEEVLNLGEPIPPVIVQAANSSENRPPGSYRLCNRDEVPLAVVTTLVEGCVRDLILALDSLA